MLKKLLIIPLLALACLFPLWTAQAAGSTQVTSVRVATRNDANTPFVRTVLDTSKKVIPRLYIDKTGRYITVTLPNAKIAKNVKKQYDANTNVVSRIWLTQRSSGTDLNIKVPRQVTKSDVKVFTLPGDAKTKKSNRVVIDVNDKSGKVKQWRHWGNESIGIQKTSTKGSWSSRKTGSSSGGTVSVPSYPRSADYSLTKGLKGKTICIDPGHGGTDTGAIGSFSQEKNITLAISKRLQSLLQKAGANVIMTRTTDIDVYAPNDGAVEELQARCNIANAAKADAFVCVHIDSYSTADAGGVTAYYNSKTQHDMGLAKYIHNQNMKATNFQDRGIRSANFYVLLHTNMPATLLELGFISNPSEEKALNSEAQQQNFAESIVKGLADYFDNNGV